MSEPSRWLLPIRGCFSPLACWLSHLAIFTELIAIATVLLGSTLFQLGSQRFTVLLVHSPLHGKEWTHAPKIFIKL